MYGRDQQGTANPWGGGGGPTPMGRPQMLGPDPFTSGGGQPMPGQMGAPGGWPPPGGSMNKPLPAQWPGMGAPIQPPMDKGIQSMTGGGLQSGPGPFGGTATGPPGLGGQMPPGAGGMAGMGGPPGIGGAPMPPWLSSIQALLGSGRGMMGNDPSGGGMGRGPMTPPGVGVGAPPISTPPGPGVPGTTGTRSPVAATPPVPKPRMAQGKEVVERGGVQGIVGRGGNFQKLGKAATRKLK